MLGRSRISGATSTLLLLMTFCLASEVTAVQDTTEAKSSVDRLRVMSWNIWHGGREDGKEVGPQRVIDVIRDSNADIVAMQETYGSGEIISKALKFNFQPRGTNLSIHSRYPIVEDISVFEEFKCVGSLIQLPDQSRVAFYCIWLPYQADIWLPGTRGKEKLTEMLAACDPSKRDLERIYSAIEKRLSEKKYADVPIIIAGDFNSMSHLDYAHVATGQYKQVVSWPTSHVLSNNGFRDSYREANPVIDRKSDVTWSPKFPEQEQDRIDFIYYKTKAWRTVGSKVIRDHSVKFPSDHAALVSEFRKIELPTGPSKLPIRAVSYNIKRGFGMDGKTDIARSAKLLGELKPDFVGLQEIDVNATRSGNVNQAAELGKSLNMHAAFSPFMDFQGGEYGMAVLSRFPIKRVHHVRLPQGNEPRVALAVEVRLPDDSTMMLVNVHFDWVNDDKFRFAQAQTLKKYLNNLEMPYILLGDFNDQPGSRTVELLGQGIKEASKPKSDHFTFSSVNPDREIDFIFASPESKWSVVKTQVIDEPVVSDHRPVVADLLLELSGELK